MAIKIIHKKCGMAVGYPNGVEDNGAIYLCKERESVIEDDLVCIFTEKETKSSITKKIIVGYKYIWDDHDCRVGGLNVDFPISEYDIIEE